MARLDFSRLSVLLVEDSQFMRSLFIGILRALGVEKITAAENGEEAIAIMRPSMQGSGPMVGQTGIDIIISDCFMPVVDGMMLLRWIRRADKSPDRFLPVIMISAAADKDVLFGARDAGVDEFLAKPFSAEMLAKRLTAAIESPRQYIYCPTYFGPDRRRQNKPVKDDQRKTTKDDIEVVHSGKGFASMRGSKKKVWIFRLPKNLKNKLHNGFAGEDEGTADNAFDPEALKEAENMVKSMESDYADWVGDSIEVLVQAHHRAVEDMQNAQDHLETMHNVGHELRGQGGIFGYPLMTQFGKSLYEITKEGTVLTGPLLDLIKSHIDLIKVVMNQRIKGDGGETGKELLKSLDEAKQKHAKDEN